MPASATQNERLAEQRAAHHQVDNRCPSVDLERLRIGGQSAV
ncbi:MAG: hypothetical protein WD830_07425 [Chloroflexota bacterium]